MFDDGNEIFDSRDVVVVNPEIESIVTTTVSETEMTDVSTTVGTDFWYRDVREFTPKQTFVATAISVMFIVFMVWFFGGKRGS